MIIVAFVLVVMPVQKAEAQQPPDLDLVLEETIVVNDDNSSVPGLFLTQEETVRVDDEQTTFPPLKLSHEETVTVTDGNALVPALTLTIDESIVVGDSSGSEQQMPPTATPSPVKPPTAKPPASEPTTVIKRAFVGQVTEVSEEFILVETDGVLVTVFVTPATTFRPAVKSEDSLSDIFTKLPAKVVVVAFDPPVSGEAKAQYLTYVPVTATRQHRRVVVTSKERTGGKTLDADGKATDVTGVDELKEGDSAVLLVQPDPQTGIERIKSYYNAAKVANRLRKWTLTVAGDPLKLAGINTLIEKRDDNRQANLQKIADKSDGNDRELLLAKVKALKELGEARQVRKGSGQTITNCVTTLLGRQAGSFADLNNLQQQRVNAECLTDDESPTLAITSPKNGSSTSPGSTITLTASAKDNVGVTEVTFSVDGKDFTTIDSAPFTARYSVPASVSSTSIRIGAVAVDEAGNKSDADVSVEVIQDPPPKIRITSPVEGVGSENAEKEKLSDVLLEQGQKITISAEAEDNDLIVSVFFQVNGVDLKSQGSNPYSAQYTVPNAIKSLKIVAIATDNSGNRATDTVVIDVEQSTAPKISIVTPASGTPVNEGDTVLVTVESDDDSAIATMFFSVGSETATVTSAPFAFKFAVPGGKPVSTSPSNALPHVFVGTATIAGAPAPDGTVVVAYMDGSKTSTLKINVSAFNESGQSGKASLELDILGASIIAGEATVVDGNFTVTAVQPQGQSFIGKTIRFTVDGRTASQTADWKAGGADILDLTVR